MIPIWALILAGSPAVLQVGDGRQFVQIAAAVKAAPPGAEIDVFPASRGYAQTALRLSKPLHLRAMGHVLLDGRGFDFSGVGSVPRAIVQFDPGASGSSITGFEMCNAHNASFNGAAIRIQAARNVNVTRCDIHDNDMGIMSSGIEGDPQAGSNQRYEECLIHGNGNTKDPGYNHNLYLDGSSAYLNRCVIYGSVTGHNLKSRAHFTQVTNSLLFGGANRQIDCVNSWNSARAASNLVVYNCVIAMDPLSVGNGNVIHFGRENGDRNGCAYLLACSVYTEFLSPVLLLTSPGASAKITDSMILNPDPVHRELLGFGEGVSKKKAQAGGDLLSFGYSASPDLPMSSNLAWGPVKSSPPVVPGIGSTAFTIVAPSKPLRMEPCAYIDTNNVERSFPRPRSPGADPKLAPALLSLWPQISKAGS